MNSGLFGGEGFWYRVPVELHGWWYEITRRGDHVGVPFDEFSQRLPEPLTDPGGIGYVVLTYASDADKPPYDETPVPRLAAWWVTRTGVFGVSVAVATNIGSRRWVRNMSGEDSVCGGEPPVGWPKSTDLGGPDPTCAGTRPRR